MILTLHPETPQVRHLERIAELLHRDGVIAYPTDTLFGLGCLASRKKAVDRILQIKGRDPKKPMSILCSDMEMFCRYTRHLDTPTFRILKQMLPGPYTVLLPASREVPRYLQNKQVVGLRIPGHPFCEALVALLGLLAAIPSCRLALSSERGRALLPMLKASGRAQLLVGGLLAVGLAWG